MKFRIPQLNGLLKDQFTFKCVVLVLAVFLFTPMIAQANWRVDWEAGLFVEYTDNVRRTDSNEDSDVVIEPRGSINATHLGPKFDAEISAESEYRGYSDGTIGNRNDFDLDAILDWKISPELFTWTFEDHFSTEFPIDIRDAPNQQNQQNVNTFVTGPTFTPEIFSNTRLNFEGRYLNTQSESSNIDNDRLQGTVGIIRDINTSSSISLNYSTESVNFDDDNEDPLTEGNVDFDRHNYYVQYDHTRSSLGVSAQVGFTKINRDSGPNKTSDGANNSIDINYTINSTSSLGLNAYDGFSDTSTDSLDGGSFGLGSGFNSVGGTVGGGFQSIGGDDRFGDVDLSVTGDTVDNRGFSLRYNKQFSKLGSSFEIFTREEEYDLVEINDRDIDGAIVEFSLPYSDRVVFGLSGEFRETDFTLDNRNDEDLLIQFEATNYITRNWRLESSIDYRDRDSDVEGSDFDAFEIRAGIVYQNF